VDDTRVYAVGTFDDLDDAVRLARRLLATAAPSDHRAGRLRAATTTDGDAARYLSLPIALDAELIVEQSLLIPVRAALKPVVPDAVARMTLFELGDCYLSTPLTGDLLAALAAQPALPVLLEYGGPIPRELEDAFLSAAVTDPALMVWEACWPAVPVQAKVQVTLNTSDFWIEERLDGHAVHLHLPAADQETAEAIAAGAGTTVLGGPYFPDW
jgi:hypothetical protein